MKDPNVAATAAAATTSDSSSPEHLTAAAAATTTNGDATRTPALSTATTASPNPDEFVDAPLATEEALGKAAA